MNLSFCKNDEQDQLQFSRHPDHLRPNLARDGSIKFDDPFGIVKYLDGEVEGDAVLGSIRPGLLFVPCKYHVYTIVARWCGMGRRSARVHMLGGGTVLMAAFQGYRKMMNGLLR